MSERTIFLDALDIPDSAARVAFLDRACGTDAALRGKVDALLAAFAAADNFLDPPVPPTATASPDQTHTHDPAGTATVDHAPGGEAGAVIAGRYTLLERVGEGGMGEVWVAKQTEPVNRKVAVKLIKAGMDSKAVLARFEAERQALALMDHPNIARVFDGGLTATGRPYFVMELVNGLPLTQFCDQMKLSPKARLELFIPVCQAVQHAHQKGIVHRDLKPSNILVTLYDGKPVPKVIDFGVAKATGGKLTDATLSTQFGAVIGTLEYMSPEQAGFSALDVDTRADIYSLGVVLYELLTGLRPFDSKRLKQAAFDEVLRIIREEEPPRPSTRLSSDASLPSLAAVRQTDPRRLTALMRGELDWVVMKCLEKDRGRRYETANGLVREIQRYLSDEPVEARPPSVRYRARKFLRRNRGAVWASAGAAAVLVGLFAVLVIGIIQGDNANRRYEAALQKELDSKKRTRAALDDLTADTLGSLFTQQQSVNPTQREVLRRLLGHYQSFADEEGDDPETQLGRILAHVRIGRIQHLIGDHVAAEESLRRAVALAGTASAPAIDTQEGWAAVARAHFELAQLYSDGLRHELALPHNRESVAAFTRVKDADPSKRARHDVALARLNLTAELAELHLHDAYDAENRILISELEQLVAEFPNEPGFILRLSLALHNQGVAARQRGQYDLADKPSQRGIALARRYVELVPVGGSGEEQLAQCLGGRADLFDALFRPADAEPLRREALAIRLKQASEYPSIHRWQKYLVGSRLALAGTLRMLGRYRDAVEQSRLATQTAKRLSEASPQRLVGRNDSGR